LPPRALEYLPRHCVTAADAAVLSRSPRRGVARNVFVKMPKPRYHGCSGGNSTQVLLKVSLHKRPGKQTQSCESQALLRSWTKQAALQLLGLVILGLAWLVRPGYPGAGKQHARHVRPAAAVGYRPIAQRPQPFVRRSLRWKNRIRACRSVLGGNASFSLSMLVTIVLSDNCTCSVVVHSNRASFSLSVYQAYLRRDK